MTFVSQTEGIESSKLDRRCTEKECMRCAWPADQKGSYKTMHSARWIQKEKGTAHVPAQKE